MFSKIATGIASMAVVANAHILMTNPVPFAGTTENGPLEPDGSNFPCKAVSYEAGGVSNVYEQGSVQQLKFKGTAVHGGGSCQVSVTTDLAPTADSVWKVIKSIEGGCPARDTPLNLPGDSAELETPFAYDFTIPADLAAGDYVVAWSWVNKIGNREFYMNCAPMTVTGSGGSDGFLDTLPDMFVANLSNRGTCTTDEGTDIQYPNPGNEVENGSTSGSNFGAPKGECGPSGGNGGSAPPTQPPSQPEQGLPEDGAGDAPVVENPQTPPPADAPSGGFAAGEACSTPGVFNCIDGSSFQQCASGAWSVAQSVAPGTTCQVGQSNDLALVVKRTTRRSRVFPIRF